MTHLLDTNICSAYLKRPGGLAHRFMQHVGGLAIPTIVLAELYTWAFRRPQPEPLLGLIEDDLMPDVQVLDFDAPCARRFGEMRATLLKGGRGRQPGRFDDRRRRLNAQSRPRDA